jgi:beta-galactosidase
LKRLLLCLALAVAAFAENLPRFAYGAVYFRKTNPPREDWERDYAQAAKDGMNTFRHWFMWGAIEVEPGKFDWADYDAQLDLAAKYHIRTVIGEVIHSAPEWAFRRFEHAQFINSDGRKVWSQMRNSSVTGGFPGLCLDNDDYRAAAERFLTELARRYRKHPGMAAYDIWNECNLNSSGTLACYCPATIAKFREYLRARYGDVKTLAKAWKRFSYVSWDDVVPPRGAGPYPDYLDWTDFRISNAYRQMKWRADTIRRADPDHPITAHGMYDSSVDHLADRAIDHWRSAAEVDIFGFTGLSANEDRIEKNLLRWGSVDMTRAGSRGKAFWAAETSGGPSWVQPAGVRENGRIPGPADIRLAQMIMMAGGATGIFSPRWRPLLDGPLYGAYGYYAMDGSPTPNSDMASRIGRWATSAATEPLWRSRPIRGDVGILLLPESQIHATLLDPDQKSENYANSARGAYAAFFDSGIQADYVRLANIDEYDLLYLPYPLMMDEASASTLMAWVERGGKLVSEACPAYFSGAGHVGTVQPGLGWDRIFGAREEYVEFTRDLLVNLTFQMGGKKVAGGINLQAYRLTGGAAAGHYSDGRIAAVDHTAGKGRTRLIGTHPGAGYFKTHSPATREFFSGLLDWAGKTPQIRRTGSAVVRLHDGPGGTYLWIVNNKTQAEELDVTLSSQWSGVRSIQMLWGERPVELREGRIHATVGPLDAIVAKLVK